MTGSACPTSVFAQLRSWAAKSCTCNTQTPAAARLKDNAPHTAKRRRANTGRAFVLGLLASSGLLLVSSWLAVCLGGGWLLKGVCHWRKSCKNVPTARVLKELSTYTILRAAVTRFWLWQFLAFRSLLPQFQLLTNSVQFDANWHINSSHSKQQQPPTAGN